MQLKLKKIKVNQLLVLAVAIVIALFLIRPINKKSEEYDGQVGPSPGPSPSEKITKEDLESVLKFIQ